MRLLATALLMSSFASVLAAQVTTPEDPALRGLRSADSAWNAASASRNVDRMMTFYLPNATADLGGAPARGADAVRRLWTRAYADTSYLLTWVNERAELMAGTDLGFTIGKWTLVRARGTQMGTYFAVWRREPDGTWKVLIDTAR
jgi:ketosteroid isomerase-like protein